MPIVTNIEIADTLGLSKFGHLGTSLSNGLMHMLSISDLNKIYDTYSYLDGLDFINAVLNELGIKVEISDADKKKIPIDKPFIAIGNHPLGGIDGLIMMKILMECHPKAMILANFLLCKIKPIADHICPVNPFETRKDVFRSTSGIRSALIHLEANIPLGIFPAGEVSQKSNFLNGKITDKIWDKSALKLIKKANVPVIPMYFNAQNSPMFYFMAGIHHNFRTAGLPGEVMKTRNKKIQVRIGSPIGPNTLKNYDDIDSFGDMLRQQLEVLTFFKKRRKKIINLEQYKFKKVQNIAQSVSKETIKTIIQKMEIAGDMLFSSGDYKIFFTKIDNKPELLHEIGRLREITFRSVGEGTNKSIDTDHYDHYYHHLILWDDQNKAIAGAYRLGLGKKIYQKYGINGFYIQELFHLQDKMHEIMSQSIEMGRSFIVQNYQQKPTPLFNLWKGIMIVAQQYPDHKYLIGAASISNDFSDCSKALITRYLEHHYLDQRFSSHIKPKKHYKYPLNPLQKRTLKELINGDICDADKIISNIEPDGKKIPILIKKYLKQNASVLGINVDPTFNNALDVLMYIEIKKLKTDIFER
ncbi:MAG: lysophospholipid acyltransferase family protein [Saprospiraceae bacterium]|nr:lysophospholipid acyltransferase family protein [Saprospiraceae bacterium]